MASKEKNDIYRSVCFICAKKAQQYWFKNDLYEKESKTGFLEKHSSTGAKLNLNRTERNKQIEPKIVSEEKEPDVGTKHFQIHAEQQRLQGSRFISNLSSDYFSVSHRSVWSDSSSPLGVSLVTLTLTEAQTRAVPENKNSEHVFRPVRTEMNTFSQRNDLYPAVCVGRSCVLLVVLVFWLAVGGEVLDQLLPQSHPALLSSRWNTRTITLRFSIGLNVGKTLFLTEGKMTEKLVHKMLAAKHFSSNFYLCFLRLISLRNKK